MSKLKLGKFGNWIENTWKIVKCGAGKRMEKSSWTDHVKNEEVLHRVKEERNTLRTITRRKANWIGHILLKNCF
jgi:hypothetical protein